MNVEPEVKDDPFNEFIVDENAPVNKSLVADIIRPYIDSIGKNKIIHFNDDYDSLVVWKKILIYLCVRKVMLDKGIVEVEEIGIKDLMEDAGLDRESAKNISRARDKNLKPFVQKNDKGFFLPNYKLKKLNEKLQNG